MGERKEQHVAVPSRRRRRWLIGAAGVVALGAATGGGLEVIGGDDGLTDGKRAFCDALTEPVDEGIKWSPGIDVIVFFEPGTSKGRIDSVELMVRKQAAVEAVHFVDEQGAYDEFVELFADNPEMIAAVEGDTLPPSIRIELADDSVLPRGALDGVPGIYRVSNRTDVVPNGVRTIDVITEPLVAGGVPEPDEALESMALGELIAAAPDAQRGYLIVIDEAARGLQAGLPPDASARGAARRLVDWYEETCGGD